MCRRGAQLRRDTLPSSFSILPIIPPPRYFLSLITGQWKPSTARYRIVFDPPFALSVHLSFAHHAPCRSPLSPASPGGRGGGRLLFISAGIPPVAVVTYTEYRVWTELSLSLFFLPPPFFFSFFFIRRTRRAVLALPRPRLASKPLLKPEEHSRMEYSSVSYCSVHSRWKTFHLQLVGRK